MLPEKIKGKGWPQVSVVVSAIVVVATFSYFHFAYSPATSPTDWHDLESIGFPDFQRSLGSGQGEDAVARAEYTFRRLRNPETGVIPEGIHARSLAKAQLQPRRDEGGFKQSSSFVASWTSRGPINVGGRTRALAIDLDYNRTTNQRILAGGISGGMYLSEDDGASWRLTTSLSDLASVTAIAQDPQNRNVWYHGTGEVIANSAQGVGAPFLGQGIFKSTDSGVTWAQLPATTSDLNVFDNIFDRVWNIAVHPTSGAVFAAVHGTIVRSTDGGDSWFIVLGPDQPPFGFITDVAIGSDGTVYATISLNGSGTPIWGVFRSFDQGLNWENITPAALKPDPWRMVIAPAPSDPNTAYLIVQSNQSGSTAADHEFFRFNGATGSWTNLSNNLPNVTQPDPQGNPPISAIAQFNSQGGYDLLVKVKPDNPDVVWVGGTNLYRSTDGGQTFDLAGGYGSPYVISLYDTHHPDQHAIAFYPDDPNAMLSGHDGGVTRTNNVLADPTVWTSLNNGYLTSQFYAVAIDPEPGSDFIIGGLQDNGTWSTNTADEQSPWVSRFSGDGGFAAVAPGGLPFYVSSQLGNVFRADVSNNQLVGTFVKPAGAQNFAFITPYLLDPNDPRIMYLAAGNLVWRNSNLDDIPLGNGAETSINWRALTGSSVPNTQVSTLHVTKTPANRLYFGATDFQFSTHLIRVDNPAANAAGIDITPQDATPGSNISSIASNPDDGDEMLVTFSNYGVPRIFHSTNGGNSWANIEGNLGGADGPSIAWALIMPTASGTVYMVATSTGVYSTELLNGASTVWLQEGADVLGNVNVDMLVGRPEDGIVVAGTHGRGVYSANLQGFSGSGVITADIDRLELAAVPGQIATGTFEISNNGSVNLSYSVSSNNPGKKAEKQSILLSTIRKSGEKHLSRKSFAAGKSNSLEASSAGELPVEFEEISYRMDDELIYDDGDSSPDDFWGFGDQGKGLFWGNEFVMDGFDFQLDRFEFYMRSESEFSNNVWVAVYDSNAEALVSGTVELNAAPQGGWFEVFWNDPLEFVDGETFFIEIGASDAIQFPAGIDAEAQVTGQSFFASLEDDYVNLATQTGSGFENGAFLIRAIGTIGEEMNQPPNVEAVVSTFNAVVGEDIVFDASASSDPDGNIVSYFWEFGDGTTSNQAVTTHAYSTAGTFTAVVTVTDDDGDSAQAAGEFTITGAANQAPVAVIDLSSSQVATGETITFTGTQSSDADGQIVAYRWNFGDGVESSLPVAQHEYTLAGSYTATLSVTDDDGAIAERSATIDVIDQTVRISSFPSRGVIPPSESRTITISYNTSNLPEGIYQDQITIVTSRSNLIIPVNILVSSSVSSESENELPTRVHLAPNYPNPFNPETIIRYELPASVRVSLGVFDLNGRKIRNLATGSKEAGIHEVRWDANDERGNAVSSGVYFYQLKVYGERGSVINNLTGKMTLIR